MDSPVELSKLDIAKLQIERALVLMLDEKDYVSAITLAGASEEITGTLLRKRERLSAYDQMKTGFERIFHFLHGHAPLDGSFNELANGVRNGLKHYQDGDALRFDPEDAAADILDRAVSNLWALTSEESRNMERFKQYHMNRGKH